MFTSSESDVIFDPAKDEMLVLVPIVCSSVSFSLHDSMYLKSLNKTPDFQSIQIHIRSEAAVRRFSISVFFNCHTRQTELFVCHNYNYHYCLKITHQFDC